MYQAMEGEIATRMTAGTNIARHLVGKRLNWCARALREATISTTCASVVSAPVRSTRMSKLPLPFSVRR
jgi:hypothetical protein